MRTWTDDDVEAMRYGISCAHSTDDAPGSTPAQAWQDFMRTALRRAEIEVTDEEFERAWRCMWQRSFMGGNWTLDAKAVLAAIEAAS